MTPYVPEKILRLARAVKEAGGRALLVGGCVRDPLLGIEPKDWDVEVYGVEPSRLRQLLESFGPVNVVGEAFTVYKLGQNLDVSLPRRERKTGRGHRAFVIEGDPFMTIEDAARRRDFTINAILQDPLDGEVIDPFNGRDDIERKTLRAVARETFGEDSLRVLRAAQFAARFEFTIEPETVEICRSIDLTDLPRERVWGEMEKLLLRARRPSIGLKWLYDLRVIAQLFPEMQALVGVPQESEWHPEGWILTAVSPESLIAGVTQALSIKGRGLPLREFLTRSAASPAVIPTGDSAMIAQSAQPTLADFPSANSTGTNDPGQTSVAAPTPIAESESLVWSFGTLTTRTDEVVRVMFEITLNGMLAVVRRAVNDFEIIRGVVHPVAVFVMDMLLPAELSPQRQFHNNAMNSSRPIFTLPTGVHITSVIVDARTTSVNNNVLFYFDLTLERNSDFSHDNEAPVLSCCYEVRLGDVFYHTLLTADRAREQVDELSYPKQVTVMLAALCHDFGKPATTEFIEGRIRSRGHEEAGVEPTESFLERLNIHTLDGYDVRAQVVALVRDHLKPGEFYRLRDELTDGAFRRLARRCELDLLYRVAKADSLGRNAPWVPRERWFTAEAQDWFIQRARELEVERKPPEAFLMGRHLIEMGLKPSPLFGEILSAIYEMQLDGRVRSLAEAMAAARRMMKDDEAV